VRVMSACACTRVSIDHCLLHTAVTSLGLGRSIGMRCWRAATTRMFGWLVADGWCWFVLREKYCWPVAGGCLVLREKYCWLVADKPSEQYPHARRYIVVADDDCRLDLRTQHRTHQSSPISSRPFPCHSRARFLAESSFNS
jgi:hypothetical protein